MPLFIYLFILLFFSSFQCLGEAVRLRDCGLSRITLFIFCLKFEPAHNKTYNKTCVTNKDSDQPVYPFSTAMVLVHPYLNNPETVKGKCDQRKL